MEHKKDNVYVGTMEFPFGRMKMYHMASENLEELNKMAVKLGLRKWFQDHPTHPHYDISKGKKAEAIKLGAIEINGLV